MTAGIARKGQPMLLEGGEREKHETSLSHEDEILFHFQPRHME